MSLPGNNHIASLPHDILAQLLNTAQCRAAIIPAAEIAYAYAVSSKKGQYSPAMQYGFISGNMDYSA